MTVAVRFLFMGIAMIVALVWLAAVLLVFDDASRWKELHVRIAAVDKRVGVIERELEWEER